MKYTNPRKLLKVNETELYDLMLRTSVLLEQTAAGGIEELRDLIVQDVTEADLGVVGAKPQAALKGLHAMLCYAFTCGVAFAVDQQVKNAVKVIDKMQKN